MTNMMPPNPMGLSQSPLTPAKARLSEKQKKDNHISSEKKRREAIRAGFDKLSTLVPGMEGQARSEAIVLGATVNYMQDEIARKETVYYMALDRGWKKEDIDRIYQDYEAQLRAQEHAEQAAGMASSGQGQLNGQSQFQNTYVQFSQGPPQTPVMPQQQQPEPAYRVTKSRSKSKSPGRSPKGQSPGRSPKLKASE